MMVRIRVRVRRVACFEFFDFGFEGCVPAPQKVELIVVAHAREEGPTLPWGALPAPNLPRLKQFELEALNFLFERRELERLGVLVRD